MKQNLNYCQIDRSSAGKITCAFALSLFLTSSQASAALTFFINEVGGAVTVRSDGGSLDTSGFGSLVHGGYDGIAPDDSLVTSFGGYGISSSLSDSRSVLIDPISPFSLFGVTGPEVSFTTVAPFEFGYIDCCGGQFIVPTDYLAGSPINVNLTLSGGSTLYELGFSHNASWGVIIPVSGGGSDTLTFTTRSIPEPSASVFLISSFAVALARRRRPNKTVLDNRLPAVSLNDHPNYNP